MTTTGLALPNPSVATAVVLLPVLLLQLSCSVPTHDPCHSLIQEMRKYVSEESLEWLEFEMKSVTDTSILEISAGGFWSPLGFFHARIECDVLIVARYSTSDGYAARLVIRDPSLINSYRSLVEAAKMEYGRRDDSTRYLAGETSIYCLYIGEISDWMTIRNCISFGLLRVVHEELQTIDDLGEMHLDPIEVATMRDLSNSLLLLSGDLWLEATDPRCSFTALLLEIFESIIDRTIGVAGENLIQVEESAPQ